MKDTACLPLPAMAAVPHAQVEALETQTFALWVVAAASLACLAICLGVCLLGRCCRSSPKKSAVGERPCY